MTIEPLPPTEGYLKILQWKHLSSDTHRWKGLEILRLLVQIGGHYLKPFQNGGQMLANLKS